MKTMIEISWFLKFVGSEFHVDGPAKKKPRGPIVFVSVLGTINVRTSEDRSDARPGTVVDEIHSAERYVGERLC